MEEKNVFLSPEYYENRELSWLKFNGRVLNEARDKSIPLLERLKFVSITSSNLDEFFMVRVASLRDMVHADYKKTDIAGMTATEQLEKINVATRELVELQYSTYNRSLVPQLEAKGIRIIDAFEELTAEQQEFVDKYFDTIHSEEFDLDVPFTRESWNGRMKACRGTGASLSEEELVKWENEHKKLLEEIADESFTIKHYAAINVLQVKK